MSMVSRVRSACVLTSWSVDADEHAFHVANTLLEMQLRRHRLRLRELEALVNTTAAPRLLPGSQGAATGGNHA